MRNVVIIGAGQAGAQVIIGLKKRGFDGKITLLGDEGHLPYQRPPLSKAYLVGELDEERLYFRPESFYEGVDLHLDDRAIKIDREGRTVTTEAGVVVQYDVLVICTGSRARTLPILDGVKNVITLRSIKDSQELQSHLGSVRAITIVGGGYIGLEAAAVARKLGKEVTLVEREERLLARVAGQETSVFFEKLHQGHGVEIVNSAQVRSYNIEDRCVRSIDLEEGRTLSTELVLMGIGGIANQELADDCGLEVQDGIVVNEKCVTSDPAIYAAGDCAHRPFDNLNFTMRLESVHNALEQGDIIASEICGGEKPARIDVPWFWSDQYDIKLQTAGINRGFSEMKIIGSQDANKFSVLYFKDDKLIAADCINDPPSFLMTKKILKDGLVIHPSMIEANTNLKALIDSL